MRVCDLIERTLTEALAPVRLSILDESGRHAGHAGADPRGESHFRIEIVSPVFIGKSQVARQQMVYALLAELMATRIHALSLSTRTLDEADGTMGNLPACRL
ncbi:MAG: BolA family protein [Alphaproteobacteria bacterium]